MKPRAIIRPVSGDDWCPPGETNFSFEIVLRKPLLVAQAARMLKGVAIMLAFASVRQAVCFLARRSLPSR